MSKLSIFCGCFLVLDWVFYMIYPENNRVFANMIMMGFLLLLDQIEESK